MAHVARLLLLLALLWAAPAWAVVALDAAGTSVTSNAVLTKDLTAFTVGSGSNRCMVVQISFSTQTPTALTVVWDPTPGTNQSLTAITGASANTTGTMGRAVLWGLVAPTSGNKTLTATWTTNSSDIVMDVVAWTGCDQTGGATTFANGTSNTGSVIANSSGTPTVTVTSATNNATMDASTADNGTYSLPTKTQVYLDNSPANISTGGSRAAGAATVTLAWTLTTGASAATWVSVGVNIVAAAAATAVPMRTLLGVGL